MNTKILLSSVAMSAALMMSGCGGGGSDDPKEPQTGTAYYIDAAVSGVNYKCGTQEGITDEDGTFIFEVGQSCTFYLGDIELRSVDVGLLEDGENLYETDVKIGQILQSLDADGRPGNGITIEADLIEALVEHDITSLPTTTSDLDTMLQVITDNGGTVVSAEDAQEHMDESLLKSLLSGNTFYILEYDGKDDWHVDTVEFNDDVTSHIYTEPEEFSTDPVEIDGDRLYVDEDEYLVIKEITDDYIELDFYIVNNGVAELDEVVRAYHDKSKAEAYAESLDDAASTSDLAALVAGKTYYVPGIDGEDTKILTKVIFNADATSISYEWIVGPQNSGETSITIDGNMIILGNEDQEFLGQTEDYLRILEHHSDGSTYEARWYEDQAKAEAYMNTLGGSSSSENDDTTEKTSIEYMRNHKTEKLVSTDCRVRDFQGWKDAKNELIYSLAPADNMMKSIEGCIGVAQLTEFGGVSFSHAVESVVRSRTQETSQFSDIWDSTASSTPGTETNIDDVAQHQNDFEAYSAEIEANTVTTCKQKYGTYSFMQLTQFANIPTDVDTAVGQPMNGDASYCLTLLLQSGDLSY